MDYKTLLLVVSMIIGGTALAGNAQCRNGGVCPDAPAAHEFALQDGGFCVALKTNMLYDAFLRLKFLELLMNSKQLMVYMKILFKLF